MVVAVDPQAPFNYILEEDRESEAPTVFKLKALSARELARIEDGVRLDLQRQEMTLRSGSKPLDILAAGLVGWENLKDAQGKEVPFKAGDLACLDYLLPRWRGELANAITEQTRLPEAEAKNSASGQGSPS
jgi:hypothetical protein